MCVFCAAIPATLALGANANARRRRAEKQAELRQEEHYRPVVEPKTATAVVVAGLVVCSVVYHTQLGS